MENNKKRLIKLIFILLIIIGVYYLIENKMNENSNHKKVLIIGIDAMDPKIVDKLINEGKLPNFKKLKEEGNYSKLETTIPPESPVAWSAAATGTNPGKYGIFDFINRDPERYLPKLNLAIEKEGITKTNYESAMKGIPFWRTTSDLNIPTTIIRWPVTFPPEKINGRMLSGLGVVDIKGLLNSYTFYTSREYSKEEDGAEKIIQVEKNKIINTKLSGPEVSKKNNEIIKAEADMKIKLNKENAVIIVDNKEYNISVNEWSDWIRVKFNIGFMEKVHGIFKAYLISINPDFNMYITSIQIDPENQLVDITYPKNYGKELVDEIGLFYTLGMPEDIKATNENKISKDIFLEQIKQIEEEREKMFWYEFGKFKEGIFAFAFDSGDRLQHIFWNDKILIDDGFKIAKEIEEYYIDKDRLLGELVDKINNKTYLIIFSDHGFTSFEKAVNINSWLIKNEYMSLTKKPNEKDVGELFEFVDWNNTKAYSLGFTSIYINLKGREGKGIVEEKDKEKIINEIIKDLNRLKDEKTDKKIISRLYKGTEIYHGNYLKDAPDIIIGFEPGYRMSWQNAVGGSTNWIISDNNKEGKGDHLVERSLVPGVIFTNFKISKENPNLMDIAPTILNIFNIEISKDIDGESLLD